MPKPRLPHLALVFFLALDAAPLAGAAEIGDPFASRALHAARPGDSVAGTLRAACRGAVTGAALSLAEVVDYALCNSPQTRLAWANARSQAAQVGLAEGAYLPSLSASLSRSRNDSNAIGPQSSSQQTLGTLSASYLLYDFGGRDASLENARELMRALAATQDASLQAVFSSTVQAYYQWYTAEAAVIAAKESERASLESLKAAQARLRIGSGTPAERLQAQTAASQASLSRIQSEGAAKTALGTLANAMGLDAHEAPPLQPPPQASPDDRVAGNIAELIAEAKRLRPELIAAEAQVGAARASVGAAQAAGMPSLSLFASRNYSAGGPSAETRSTAIGVALDIPLFTGFNSTYRVRAAEAQVEARLAQRDQVARQVSLDVWRAYFALVTGIEAVRASADLLASAEQSESVAAGRYRAGVGGILDLLNAQSALASARQQQIQTLYNWRIAKTALGLAMGQLDFAQLAAPAK